ncbi:MAG: initiation control protein YabA [Chitinophagales bacterium]
METTLQEIKSLLKTLIAEVADLRERVTRLENIPRCEEDRDSGEKKFVLIKESQENLEQLYLEGYHVCPGAFSQVRDEGECLFCLNFLSRK